MTKHTITSNELRALLFWAMAGYTDSNGGTHGIKVPKIIAKYCKEIKMTRRNFPFFPYKGCKSRRVITGETKDKLEKALTEYGISL